MDEAIKESLTEDAFRLRERDIDTPTGRARISYLVCEPIEQAGFTQTRVEPILGGLVAIHSGWKA